jgi:hypothetical protein
MTLTGPLDAHALAQGEALLDVLPHLGAGQSLSRAYLHWIVSPYGYDDKAYNITVSLHDDAWLAVVDTDPALNATEPPQPGYAAHTYQRNGHAIGLAVAAMDGATTSDFGPHPVQGHELEVLCAAAAACALKYGIDVAGQTESGEPTVMTHAEAAIVDGYYCGHTTDPDCRWDLARLQPSPDSLTIEEAHETADVLRARIRQYKLALMGEGG